MHPLVSHDEHRSHLPEKCNITNIQTSKPNDVYQPASDDIEFEDINVPGSRALAQSRIDHFLHRFELEGCRRLDPLTWIPSEIPSSELQKLADNGLSVGGITDLQLPEGQVLYCFQGQHRIAAALQWLPPNDRWWNFDLYDSAKLNDDCWRRLREFDEKSQHFGDGEIFRNIRYFQQRGETEAARQWLAKWLPTKCREFNRIFSPKESQCAFSSLASHLDLLLDFPALWKSWFMGTHLPSLKCPEVSNRLNIRKFYNNAYRNLQIIYHRYIMLGVY